MTKILVGMLLALAPALGAIQPPGATGCSTNIVSSTVVATYCGHHAGGAETLDLFILWRGQRGWFLEQGSLRSGGGGRSTVDPLGGRKGRVSRYDSYGAVTVQFEADFDEGKATIGDTTIDLRKANVVLVDKVDESGARRVSAAAWAEPRLPNIADPNLAIIQRSRQLRDYLQCEIPMPPRGRAARPPIITICE